MARTVPGILIFITLSICLMASGCSIFGKPSTATTTNTGITTSSSSSTTSSSATTTSTSTQTERILGSSNNQIVNGADYIVIPTDGVRVRAGMTLQLSWSADAALDGYILTEMQFSSFKTILDYNNNSTVKKQYIYTAHGKGVNGNIEVEIENTDTFFGVVFYNELPTLKSKIYQAVLKGQ